MPSSDKYRVTYYQASNTDEQLEIWRYCERCLIWNNFCIGEFCFSEWAFVLHVVVDKFVSAINIMEPCMQTWFILPIWYCTTTPPVVEPSNLINMLIFDLHPCPIKKRYPSLDYLISLSYTSFRNLSLYNLTSLFYGH